MRRQLLIRSLKINIWILMEPLVYTCVILNGPNSSPSNLRYFCPLEYTHIGRPHIRVALALRFHAYYYS